MNIVMAAAENGALEGGKVGGIADVVRDIPAALGSLGHTVHIVTPGYGLFSKRKGAKKVADLSVEFAGKSEKIQVFKLGNAKNGVTQWALEHPLFSGAGEGVIYCHDADNRPFATDATKFALFSLAFSEAVLQSTFKRVDVLHLHDWHSAFVAILLTYEPRYQPLKAARLVYTIHNLALQGIRPLRGDDSALESWFPKLNYQLEKLQDPRAKDCVNPMRAGITLCDRVHAVSPTYAKEIVQASRPDQGYFGGEGLEQDLNQASAQGRLHGILNGCEYPESSPAKTSSVQQLLELIESQLLIWIASQPTVASAHLVAATRLANWRLTSETDGLAAGALITSVGRITDQKVLLLLEQSADGVTALQSLLTELGAQGKLILLGSGTAKYEHALTKIAAVNDNFLFLRGYSDAIADQLYELGDLFLMPSSFEPCGISQMIAMRAGQPCLVHDIGGLHDTVSDGVDGFSFSGATAREQAQAMIKRFKQALKARKSKTWPGICRKAEQKRFLWTDAAEQYVKLLYSE